MTSKQTSAIIAKNKTDVLFRNPKLTKLSRIRYKTAVQNYMNYLSNNNLDASIESVQNWLETIRNVNSFNLSLQAIKEYLLKKYEHESPVRRLELNELFGTLKRKKPQMEISERQYLTREQVDLLAQNTTEIISCFILSLFQTGCRISELINVRVTDCKCADYVFIKIVGKGSKAREVSMSRPLYDRIRKVFNGKIFLFETSKGKQYTREYITREISRQSKRLGITGIGSHTFRHSKAMYLKGRGYTADQISKALGHSSPVTTIKHYFHGSLSAEEQLAEL